MENLISFRVFQPHRIEKNLYSHMCVKFLFELDDKGIKKWKLNKKKFLKFYEHIS